MAWPDRLREAAYTSPSGRRMVFDYRDVSFEFEKLTTAFDFPDSNDTYVQDQGKTGRRFPFRVFIGGPDYDEQAEVFDRMISEQGIGTLEHPLYGTFPVVPFGRIVRRDNLTTAANQAVYEITFFETNDVLFPSQVASPRNAVRTAISTFSGVAPTTFANGLVLSSVSALVTVRNRFLSVTGFVSTAMQGVLGVTAEVKRAFETVFDSVTTAATNFVGDAESLASQIGILVRIPSASAATIEQKFASFGTLIRGLTSGGTVYEQGLDDSPGNNFRNDEMFSSSLIIGAVESALDTKFTIKGDALEAADLLLGYLDEFTVWQDANLTSLALIDTGESYQQLQAAVAVAAGYLVELSFTLKQERGFILDRPRTPIDLEARLYGTVDSNLDFLIATNDLVGEEIFEIPAGRTVKYYV